MGIHSMCILFAILQLAIHIESISNNQCCSDPVIAFRFNEWVGSCACLTLTQKWNRYKDWMELNHGYVNSHITLDFVDQSDTSNRGIFSNSKRIIARKSILLQMPFSISFTQFSISKYIKNSTHIQQYFGTETPNQFIPEQFPDYDIFLLQLQQHHDNFKGNFNLLPQSICLWLALGLAWLKQNTNELLPWIVLLPSPDYLPFLFDNNYKQYIFKDTQVAMILKAMEYDFSLSYKYLNVLNIKEHTVRELYALIYSRVYQFDFSHIGGLKNSEAIPCGADFFNHNAKIEGGRSEFPVYDPLFGDHFYGNINVKNGYHYMSYVIPQMVKDIGKSKVSKRDFESSYHFVTYAIYPMKEIFVSYGANHPSHVLMGLYGFIEHEINSNDYINIRFRNYNHEKYQYFDADKSVELKYVPNDNELYCKKDSKLTKEFQLLYLPVKYMDSFTISSIMNGFEWVLLSNVLRPIIEREIQWFCYDKLMYFYETRIKQDYNDLFMIKKHMKYIKCKLNDKNINLSKNKKEKVRLTGILQQTKQQLIITKYLIREKQFYEKCINIKVLFQNNYGSQSVLKQFQQIRNNRNKKMRRN